MKARHMRIFVDRLWIKQGIVWHRILGQSPLPIDRIFTHRPSTTRGFLPQAVDYGESIKDSFQTLGTSGVKLLASVRSAPKSRCSTYQQTSSLFESYILVLWSLRRSEEHTSELQSLMRISYAVFCLNTKKALHYKQNTIIYTHTS